MLVKTKLIMIVDDTTENLLLLKQMLQSVNYNVCVFDNPLDALQALNYIEPDLILMDVNMPEMSGYDACKQIKSIEKYKKTPVLFISALNDVTDKVAAFENGGVDYITKPFEFAEVKERINIHLNLSELQKKVDILNTSLKQRVDEQLEEILQMKNQMVDAQNATILALAKLSECRDTDTGLHLERVGYYCEILARQLKKTHPEIDETYISIIKSVAALHDIGKVGIEDRILLKQSKLTDEEFEIMKTHTLIGAKTFSEVQKNLKQSVYTQMGHDVILYHHEKYNGKGYPKKLVKNEIPLCAQIMSLADVYDALRSKRPYKTPFSKEEAFYIISKEAENQFSSELVQAFTNCQNDFDEIYLKLTVEGK